MLRFNPMIPVQAGFKCLALTVFCLVLPVLSGICPDAAGGAVRTLASLDYSLSVPIWKNFSKPAISERNFPEEARIRFGTGGPLGLGGKQNSHEPHFREIYCNAILPAIDRVCFRYFFRKYPREQLLSFQTIQSATLPVRAGPSA